jgi:hypothetical protein
MQKKLVKVVITTYQMMLKGGKHTGFILTNPKNVSILVEHACRQLPAEFTQRTIIGPGKIEKSSLAWLALILPTAINTAFAPDKIVNEMKPGNHEETHNRALYRLRMRG